MGSRARYEIKLCANFAGVVLVKCSLDTEMLCAGAACGNPLEEPVVTFVPARHLQGDEKMATEKHHSVLRTFS